MKAKLFFLSILLLVLEMNVSNSYAQNLTSATANGNSNTTSSSFVDVSGASVTISATAGKKVLVVATFSGKTTTLGASEATYRLVDDESHASGEIMRTHTGYYGIGSVVNVFTVTTTGSRTYKFQHKTSGLTLTSEVAITAVELYDGTNELPSFVTTSTGTVEASSSTFTTALESNVVTATATGGFYVSASIQSAKTSGGANIVVGEWALQYKKTSTGTWTNLSYPLSRSTGNQAKGIVNIVGALPDNTEAGDYYFRVAHRKVSGADQLETQACNLVAVALATPSGFFPIMIASKLSAINSSTTFADVISSKVIPQTNTGLFLHAQYNMKSTSSSDFPKFDLYAKQGASVIYDGVDHKRYLSGSSDRGSGTSAGLVAGLTSGTEYDLSLRHASTTSRTLTTENSYLVGFGLNRSSLPFVLPVTVNSTLGQISSSYSTLKAAFDDINSGIFKGVINIFINRSITETASAVLNASGSGSASYSSVSIYPTTSGLVITGAIAAALIELRGADNVTIDGRVNQTGVASLSFVNTNATTSARTILYTNDATANRIQYCYIKGAATGTNGVIYFGSSTGTTGNDNNVIDNCFITNAGTRPTNGVYSAGTSGKENSGITISNNNFFDLFSNAATTNAIYVSGYNTLWTISGNSFYETSTVVPTNTYFYKAINITNLSGQGFEVNDNYIGGTAPQCGGTALAFNATKFHSFQGIYMNVGTTTASSVQNNTIKNISSSGTSTTPFHGIYIQTGAVNIGTVTGNTIGASIGTGSITVNGQANYTNVYGMYFNSTGTINCKNNTIGSITTTNSVATAATSFYGIYKSNVDGTTLIDNNTVGSTTESNSIQTASASSSSAQYLIGIYTVGIASANITITNNRVGNLYNASVFFDSHATFTTNGIQTSAAKNTISNNIIQNLSADNTVNGILQQSLTANQTITQNTISNLTCRSLSQVSWIAGISYNGPTTGTNAVSRNFIHSFNIASSNISSYLDAIDLYSGVLTCANNIINLGVSNTNNYYVIGIWEQGISGQNNSVYFNTIYIAGNPSGATSSTYAYYKSLNAGTTNLKNNLFVNARSGGTTGKHYAIVLPGLAGITANYNDYYVSGTNGVLGNLAGNDKTTLATWKSASSPQDVNSINIDPGFASAGGTSVSNYYTSASLNGVSGTGTTIDYVGVTRGVTPKMGALEVNNFTWKGATSTNFGTASNWLENAVPPDGADISFDSNPNNHCVLDQNRTLGSITNAQSTDKFDLNRKQLTITNNLVFTNGAQLDASGVSSTLVFEGTAAQSIPSGSLVNNTIYALTINNSYGLTLNNDLSVTQELTLTNGALNIGANTLAINGLISKTAGSLNGGSTTNIIIGGSASSNTTLPSVTLNNLTINRTLGLTLGGNVTVTGTLTLTDGALTVGANTLTLSGSTAVRTSGSIDASNASSTLIFANTSAFILPASLFSTAVNNMTINGVGGITVPSDFTVNGILNLGVSNASFTKGCLDMLDGSTIKTLTMGANATTVGIGDVTGIIKRTSFDNNINYSFGNEFTTLTFTPGGTFPTDVSFKVSLGAAPSWKSEAVMRSYDIIRTGGDNAKIATLSLHYLDVELNGNLEDEIVIWDHHATELPPYIEEHGSSNNNISENWLSIGNRRITYFGTYFDFKTWGISKSLTPNFTWQGGASSDWNDVSNWSGGEVPISTSDVLIPDASTTPNDPTLPASTTINRMHIQAGGILNGDVNSTLTVAGATEGNAAWVNDNGTFNPSTSTVIFTYSAALISGNTNFYNLTIDNGASLILGANTITRIAGALSLSSTGVLNATNSHNTVEYNGVGQTIINPNATTSGYHCLILSGSGIKTMPATNLSVLGELILSGTVSVTALNTLTIGDDFTIGDGSSFTTGNFSHNIGGNIDNNGTLTVTSGNSITMNGTAAQSIMGSNPISFHNLNINNNEGVTIYTNGTINNTLTLTDGVFKVGDVQLTINGGITKASGLIEVGVLSSFVIGESSALTFASDLFTSAPSINNLTINRSTGVSLGNQDLTVNGLLNLITGTLNITANKLTLAGSPPTKTTGNIDASNSSATVNISCTSAVVLPTSIFSGSINNLVINTPTGVSTMSDLTVNGLLDLQSANPSATAGTLNMWDGSSMRTLTLGASNICEGIGDVTGIITHQSITHGVIYYFGHPHTTAYFSNDGTLPSQVSIKMRIGVEATWKTGSIKREVEVIHTGGTGTKAIFSCHYLDSELNGNDENKLSFWMQLDPSSFEYGRSSNNTAENWVLLSSANLVFFPTAWDANRKITLDEFSTVNTLTWNGSISDSWTSVQNWTPMAGPAANRDIIIPDVSTTPYAPTLPAITEVKTLTLNSAAVLNSVPDAQLTLNGATAWKNEGGTFNASTSNVIFTNTDGTISGTTNFYNITTTSEKFLWLMSGSFIRVAGAITNNGTLRTTSNGSTTVEYNGAGAQTVVVPNVATNRYSTLILSGSGIKTMPNTALSIVNNLITSGTATVNTQAALNIDGNLTIGEGSTLNTNNYSHSLSGNLENNGTLTATSSGTSTLDGTTTQTISGTGSTNFYNLAINNTSTESVELNSSIGAANLNISSGSALTINPLASANISTLITNNAGVDGLIIKSSSTQANGTLIFGGAAPLATVEMYSKATWNLTNPIGAKYKWQFFGIPVSTAVASPLFDGAYVRLHSETGVTTNWTQLSNASTLSPFNGYEITQELAKTYYFQGTLVNANFDERILATTTGAKYPGQYIFSNPYTAAIDITKLNFGTETEASVYLYNTGSQKDWIDNSGTSDGTSPGQYTVAPKATAGTGGIPAQIPSMQGFMVVTKSSSLLSTFEIPYSSVKTKNLDIQRSPSINKAQSSEKAYTRIDVTGSRFADRMWIFSESTCTHGFDNGWDGYKFIGSGLTPQIFAMESVGNFQVNSVDNINNTELGFKAGEDSIYTMRFTNENLDKIYNEMYLIDLLENTTTDISMSGAEYTFKAKPTTEPVKRFKITTTIQHPTSIINTSIKNNSNVKVYNSKNIIFIDNKSNVAGDLILCDIAGVVFKKVHFDPNGLTTIPVNLAVGTYIAKAITTEGEIVEKLIIK